MNDVYGRVAATRLLPRERDVVSGRLTGRRDDKRRDDRRHDPHRVGSSTRWKNRTRPGRQGTSPRMWWAAGCAALLLVATITGAVAVAGRTPDSQSAAPPPRSSASGGASAAGSPRASASSIAALPVAASPSPAEPPATAIRLDYSGGKVTRKRCTDASGGGECFRFNTEYDPLVVRCTADGCKIYAYGRTSSLAAPVSMVGDVPDPDSDCAATHWTIKIQPVGQSVTEGIRHPARLVGVATSSRPAALLAKFNCLGAEEVYQVDATPA